MLRVSEKKRLESQTATASYTYTVKERQQYYNKQVKNSIGELFQLEIRKQLFDGIVNISLLFHSDFLFLYVYRQNSHSRTFFFFYFIWFKKIICFSFWEVYFWKPNYGTCQALLSMKCSVWFRLFWKNFIEQKSMQRKPLIRLKKSVEVFDKRLAKWLICLFG